MFKRILVAYDGSKSGKAALECAIAMAKASNAPITALWIREPLPRYTDLPGEAEEAAEAADEYFEARCREVAASAAQHEIDVACKTLLGHPAKAMVQFANEGNYDLIVIGHSDHSGLWGRLLGDTADRISDHAHCSVLIVKQ